MYDPLYETLGDDIEIIVHADHPTLNRRVAEMLAAGERIDVLSTHSKYAPSQSDWLSSWTAWSTSTSWRRAPSTCAGSTAPCCVCPATSTCACSGTHRRRRHAACYLGGPRRHDHAFGFRTGVGPVRDLLRVGRGPRRRLFDDDAQPPMVSAKRSPPSSCCAAWRREGRATSRPGTTTRSTPPCSTAGCHGRDVAGGYGPIRASAFYDRLEPALYPAGPARRVSYSGAHAWAIPSTCADISAAAALIQRCARTSPPSSRRAGLGVRPRRRLRRRRAADPTDERRLALTRDTIATAMITYPSLPRFPEVEDAAGRPSTRPAREVDAETAVANIHERPRRHCNESRRAACRGYRCSVGHRAGHRRTARARGRPGRGHRPRAGGAGRRHHAAGRRRHRPVEPRRRGC